MQLDTGDSLLRLRVDKREQMSLVYSLQSQMDGGDDKYTLTLSAETDCDWAKAKTNDRVAAEYDFILLLLGTIAI